MHARPSEIATVTNEELAELVYPKAGKRYEYAGYTKREISMIVSVSNRLVGFAAMAPALEAATPLTHPAYRAVDWAGLANEQERREAAGTPMPVADCVSIVVRAMRGGPCEAGAGA